MTEPQDARSARAEAAAAKARAKAMRPWYKKKRFILPLALVVLIGISIAAGGGGGDDKDNDASSSGSKSVQSSGSAKAADDVTIDACAKDDLGYMYADITILNHSSKTSNYLGTVNFLDAEGTKIAEGGIASNNIEPDQKAIEKAVTLEEAPGEFTCKVASVTRYASAG
jgi:hypothetical protein